MECSLESPPKVELRSGKTRLLARLNDKNDKHTVGQKKLCRRFRSAAEVDEVSHRKIYVECDTAGNLP